MSSETAFERLTECPSCGSKGKRVPAITLRSLLKPEIMGTPQADESGLCTADDEYRMRFEEAGWRFCDSTECDVVYFSETTGKQFTQSHLKVDVGVKQTGGRRPLCYCFGHSVASIKLELNAKGQSDALEDIRAKMKAPGCHCETANPSGACCLGSVSRGIETARAELNSERPDSPRSVGPSHRGERIAKIGTLVSAIMASSCCWLPLLLLAVGVSGVGIAAILETYRPSFMVVTFGFLASAIYFTYRPRKSASTDSDCCAAQQDGSSDCYASSATGRFSMIKMNKIMLWVVTGLAVAFLLFPSYVGALLGTSSDPPATENLNRVVVQIDGMTCQGCATTVAQAIRQVPGVATVEVRYEKSQAIVGIEPGDEVPISLILAAIQDAGYRGTVSDDELTKPEHNKTPSTHSAANKHADDELSETVFRVDGMSCEHCATALTESLQSIPGVTDVRVEFETGRAFVQTPACCTPPTDVVMESIEKAGFRGRIENSDIPQGSKGDPQ